MIATVSSNGSDMNAIEIRPGIFWVGVNDRITDLFEGQWPLPHGVSYNSYLVVGKKVALVDGVKATFAEKLLQNIAQIVPPEKIDYLIVNHMEPDHSGTLPLLRRVAPRAEILATPVVRRPLTVGRRRTTAHGPRTSAGAWRSG